MKIYFYKVTSWKRLFTVWQVQLPRERHRGYSYTSPEIRSTIMYIALYLFLFLSIVLKDENYEKYRDIYNSLLFGRGPNRVIEMACFDSKLQ